MGNPYISPIYHGAHTYVNGVHPSLSLEFIGVKYGYITLLRSDLGPTLLGVVTSKYRSFRWVGFCFFFPKYGFRTKKNTTIPPEKKKHVRGFFLCQEVYLSFLRGGGKLTGRKWEFTIFTCSYIPVISWIYPPRRIPVANEGLVRDSRA